MTLNIRLQLALTALITHCEQELLSKNTLSVDQQQKLRRLIWQIKQVVNEQPADPA